MGGTKIWNAVSSPLGFGKIHPETLQRYRRIYQELFQAHLSPTSDINCCMTKLSLYVENLVIAAEDTVCRFEIVKKFLEEILPLTLNLAEVGEREKLMKNFTVFDISSGLVDGTLEQRFIDLLRRGFEALLAVRLTTAALGYPKSREKGKYSRRGFRRLHALNGWGSYINRNQILVSMPSK